MKVGTTDSGTPFDPDEYAASLRKPERDQGLAAGVVHAQQFQPDQYAVAKRTGTTLGMPADVVARNPEQAQRQQLQQRLGTASPRVGDWMAEDPARVTLAADSVDHLDGMDEFFNNVHTFMNTEINLDTLGRLKDRATAGGAAIVSSLVYKLGDDQVQMLGGDTEATERMYAFNAKAASLEASGHPVIASIYRANANYMQGMFDLRQQATDARAEIDRTREDLSKGLTRSNPEYYLGMAADSSFITLGAMATGGAASLGGLGAAGAAWVGAGAGGAATYAQAYQDARTEGHDAELSHYTALAQGAIEVLGEKFGMGKIWAQGLGKGKRALVTAGREAIGEGVTEAGQTVADALITDKEIDPTELAWQTLDATIVGGLMGGPEALLSVREPTERERARAQDKLQQILASADGAARLSSITGIAVDSTLGKRSPEDLASFVEKTAGADTHVYVDAAAFQELFQSAQMDPTNAALEFTGDAAALPMALASGGDIAIPMAKYLAAVARSPIAEDISQHARLRREDLSPAELGKFKPEDMLAEVMGGRAAKPTEQHNTESDEVRVNLEAQLMAHGVDRAAAQRYGALYGSVFRTLAQRSGKSVKELWDRYGLKISNTRAMAAEIQQESVDAPAFKAWFGDSKAVDESGAPATVYHGSMNVFDTFESSESGAYGAGIYFGTKEDGSSYGTPDGKKPRGVVYPVHLSLQNPLEINNNGAEPYGIDDALNKLGSGLDPSEFDDLFADGEQAENFKALVEAGGYDGIIITHSDGSKEYVAFNATQIKSVNNRGTWDGGDGNILNQSAAPPAASADVIDLVTGAEKAPKLKGKTEVAQFLERRGLDRLGRVLDLEDAGDRDHIADAMAREAMHALSAKGNAGEWYDETIRKLMRLMAVKYTEIETDPDARTAFTLALAITSQNLAVPDNLKYADEVYRHFREHGRWPEIGFGAKGPSMVENFRKANALLAEFDGNMDTFRRFLATPFTVRQLTRMGFQVGGELADENVLGSSVFGPKIGFGFYSNLTGNFDPVTMDMWFMRTIGRLRGKLMTYDPVNFQSQLQRLREADPKTKKLDEDHLVEEAFAIAKRFEKDYKDNRAKYDSGKKKKSQAVYAAQTIVKSLKSTVDAPASGQERRLLRDIVARAIGKMAVKTGILPKAAAFQALIWYPEQALYKNLGVTLKAFNVDYATSARDQLLEQGYDPGLVESAARTARPPATDDGRGTAGSGQERSGGNEGLAPRDRKRLLTQRILIAQRIGGSGNARAPKSYSRASGSRSDRLRGVVASYKPSVAYGNVLDDAEYPRVTLEELDNSPASAKRFADALRAAKESSPFGAAVYVYDEADYTGQRLFIAPDGKSGFSIKKDGDIVSVFSDGGGKTAAMLQLAVQQGGTKLDAFNTALPGIYGVSGFRETSRKAWNNDYRPDGWEEATFSNYEGGRPSIIYMRFDPAFDPDAELPAPMAQAEQLKSLAAMVPVLDAADTALEGEAARAVTEFVGHEPGARESEGFGLMLAHRLEAAVRDGGEVADKLEQAFAPVREQLRAAVGDTVRLYRVQGLVIQDGSVISASVPAGERAVLSWTASPRFAKDYAGMSPKPSVVYSEEEIAAFEATLATTGEVKIGRQILRPGKSTIAGEEVEFLGIYERNGDLVTDTESVRQYVSWQNEWANESNETRDAKREKIVSADVPLDQVIWATHRAGQMEFIVANDGGTAAQIDGTGKPVGPGVVPNDLTELNQSEFRSRLVDTVDAMKDAPKKGDAAAWKGWLNGKQSKGEISKSERDWMGVDQWLDSQDTVTREQLQEFVRASQVKVEVTELADAKQITLRDVRNARDTNEGVVSYEIGDFVYEATPIEEGEYALTIDGNNAGEFMNLAQAEEAIAEHAAEQAQLDADSDDTGTRHSDWQTPGSIPGTYREILIQLPPSNDGGEWKAVPRPSGLFALQRPDGSLQLHSGDGSVNEWVSPDAAMRAANTYKKKDGDGNFRSSHFDQPNIVAHLRVNERTDADGNRVLFVEEIQSDWHQMGRKKGYAGQSQVLTAQEESRFEYLRSVGGALTADERTEFADLRDRRAATSDTVPDAPFKATDEWAMLAFKQAVAYAVERGIDRIAWTTGEQQAKRYDLSQRVDNIDYAKGSDGLYTLKVKLAGNGGYKTLTGLTESTLEDNVGKEITKKIIDGEGREAGAPEGSGLLKGLDLKVGGEGMKGFYDNILPKAVAKWGKKFGVTLGETTLGSGRYSLAQKKAGGRWYVFDSETKNFAAFSPSYATPQEANAEIAKANEATAQQSITITPELKAAAQSGLALFQRPGEEPRGSIQLVPGAFQINLFAGADLSTFLHESGHFFLEIMGDLAQDPGASDQIRADYAATLAWFGVSDRASVGRDQHEQFARGFESYLREGKAPSEELRGVFARFGVWLREIYKSLSQLNVQITDEVRGVFDRLIATDEEIEAAQVRQGFQPLADAKTLGLTDAQLRTYIAMLNDATTEAREEVTQKLLAAHAAEKSAAWKEELTDITAEVTADIDASPVYRTLSLLRRGVLPDGTAHSMGAVKLSKGALVSEFGKGVLAKLRGMYWVESGTDTEIIALRMGFKSGTDMVVALMDAPPRAQAIKDRAAAEMRRRHPDPMVDGSLPEMAMAAIHGDKRVGLLQYEMDVLAKLSKSEAPKPRMLRAVAAFQIDAMLLKDIKPNDYLVAERKAARLALQDAAAGDYAGAFRNKRAQALNAALYRAALDAKEYGEKARQLGQKMGKPASRARLGKAGESFLEAVDEILATYQFLPLPRAEASRRAAVAASLLAQAQAGTLEVPQRVLDAVAGDTRTRWDDLTMGDLRGVVDTLKQIQHQARESLSLRIGQETLDREEVDRQMSASVLAGNEDIAKHTGDKTRMEKVRSMWAQGRAIQGTASDIARELDGFADGGAVWDHTVRIIRDAVSKRLNPALDAAGEALAALYLQHYTKDEIRSLDDPQIVPGIVGRWSRGRRIALALNWGNAENRTAILEGNGLTEAQVNMILADLTGKDWDFVEGSWELIDSYWPDARDVERRRRGLAPKKVEAEPFTMVVDGQSRRIRGGYYPLKAEGGTIKSMNNEINDYYQQLRVGRTGMAKVTSGSLIERVGFGKQPVRLDLGVISQHLVDTIRVIHLSEPVNYVHNAMAGPAFAQSLNDTGMAEHLHALEVWLKDVSTGEIGPRTFYERFARAVRQNFTASVLTWKLSSALLQVTGILQSAPSLGWDWVGHGVRAYTMHPLSTMRYVHGASPYMLARAKTHTEAVQEVMNAQAGTLKAAHAAMLRYGFMMMGKVQLTVDIATWLGAEAKGMSLFGNDVDKARAFADDAVARAQGSQEFSDKTPMQRGTLSDGVRQAEIIKAMTMLGGYMLAKGNIAYEQTRKTNFRKPAQALKWSGNMVSLFVVETLIVAAIKGAFPGDDDDDGTMVDDIAGFGAKEGIFGVLGSFPGTNLMVSQLRGYDSGGVVGNSAGLLNDLTNQVEQGEWDKAMRKVVVKIGGVLTGAPSTQINQTLDAIDSEKDLSAYEYFTGPQKEKRN